MFLLLFSTLLRASLKPLGLLYEKGKKTGFENKEAFRSGLFFKESNKKENSCNHYCT